MKSNNGERKKQMKKKKATGSQSKVSFAIPGNDGSVIPIELN